ncbi:gluconate 2-dehydrogenase subunit 3-like protein [Leeuwenhoekiella aestuarii]|uniref:Gluconate 2-dehydrogenase subunit 3-like protein n=1 Tax=Leeuwenhoekiella aestuarii TaxID=2249426 RepID=A0A4Q0NRA2_9FLAO|nr:gluconate 2-dehydrogenase subunit 3 family protein [Leeuwenhoekiella aestuarii]RXG13182.1 gluconate 2-dehydrogenase subunit 3-like protein [Leeuwenhoekiella aestuarii]RXG15082.1 gluconate 2-dehydrogenase subunit 3-like protein [Leeuwenhoekiella aestuarii]
MDRRDSLKSMFLGSLGTGLFLTGCNTDVSAPTPEIAKAAEDYFGRTPEEAALIEELNSEQFFNEHEMETLNILCALILPANDEYGSATDAGVPDFLEFIVKDMPHLKTPIRGGLMWLDHASNSKFNTEFKEASEENQKAILDTVAFPDPDKPGWEQPVQVQFFSLMRNLTMTGYYTSEMGIKDLDYKGNQPNIWDGVPEEVLQKHGVSYDPEWIAKCVDQSQRGVTAEWDDEGNLIT